MSDALRKDIPISQPTYCTDDQGDIIPGTIMYNWMHIRAVGPNCLKDTTLCGVTDIHKPCIAKQVFGLPFRANSYLANYLPPNLSVGPWVQNDKIINWYYWISTLNPPPGLGGFPDPLQPIPLLLDEWYPMSYGVSTQGTNPPVDWATEWCVTSDIATPDECIEKVYGVTNWPLLVGAQANVLPPATNFAKYIPSLRNLSGVNLTLQVKLSGRISMDWNVNGVIAPVGGDMNWTVGVGEVLNTEVDTFPMAIIAPNTSPQPCDGSTFYMNLSVDTAAPPASAAAVNSPYDGTFSATFLYVLPNQHVLLPYFLCSSFIPLTGNPINDILISPSFSDLELDAQIIGINDSIQVSCFPINKISPL